MFFFFLHFSGVLFTLKCHKMEQKVCRYFLFIVTRKPSAALNEHAELMGTLAFSLNFSCRFLWWCRGEWIQIFTTSEKCCRHCHGRWSAPELSFCLLSAHKCKESNTYKPVQKEQDWSWLFSFLWSLFIN